MKIRDAINNSPDDWMVDIRSRDNGAVNSFPVRELRGLIPSVSDRPMQSVRNTLYHLGDNVTAITHWNLADAVIRGTIVIESDRIAIRGVVDGNTDGHGRVFPIMDCWDVRIAN